MLQPTRSSLASYTLHRAFFQVPLAIPISTRNKRFLAAGKSGVVEELYAAEKSPNATNLCLGSLIRKWRHAMNIDPSTISGLFFEYAR